MEKEITLKLFVEDFRAKLSALQDTDEDLKTLGERCSSSLQDLQEVSNLSIYSLRMSKGFSITTRGETFRTILATLDELGYDAEWQVLNSKDFGVPQNRERVFIVGHLRGERTRQIFPLERTGGQNPRELKVLIAGKHQGYSVYDVNGISTTLTSQTGGLGGKTGLYTVCLDKPVGIGSQSKFFIKKQVSTASCLVARDYKGIRKGSTCVLEQFNGIKPRIRKLTPLEYFRLQGFPDEFYYKAKQAGVSDSQLYKQAGNSVTVNVIEVIACNFEEVKI